MFYLSLRVWFWQWFYMRYLMEFIGKCPFPSSSLERLLSHVRTPVLSFLMAVLLSCITTAIWTPPPYPNILLLNSLSQVSQQTWEIACLILLQKQKQNNKKHVMKSQGSPCHRWSSFYIFSMTSYTFPTMSTSVYCHCELNSFSCCHREFFISLSVEKEDFTCTPHPYCCYRTTYACT